MRLTCSEIASRTRGRILSGDPNRACEGASIDSRTLKPGDAFFAVKGEVHDGHRFTGAAARAGAAALVVSDASAAQDASGATVIVVGDPLRALQDLASSVRDESRAIVCGITGSVGKTTTKDLASLLISGRLRTHATPGNLNNHYGLPLAILSAPADTEAFVLEMGISTPGEMDRLVEIARPDLGLVTMISAVHVGNFPSFATLCDEKMKLPRGSRRAVLNADDAEQAARAPRGARWFGESERADVRLAKLVSRGLLGTEATLAEDPQYHVISLPLPGAHQARNLVAAAALARAAGVSWDVIARQAALATPGKHRGQVIRLSEPAGAIVVDDTYNANPLAMRAALALLREVEPRPGGRRVFVAGGMLELGDISAREHRALGAHAAPLVDVLVAVGHGSDDVAAGASDAGSRAVTLKDADAAGEWLRREMRAGDVVLLKGSRGIGLDRAVDAACGVAP